MTPKAKKPAIPKAPRHLSPATKAWWKTVCSEYEMQSHHLRLLQNAAEAWGPWAGGQGDARRPGAGLRRPLRLTAGAP